MLPVARAVTCCESHAQHFIIGSHNRVASSMIFDIFSSRATQLLDKGWTLQRGPPGCKVGRIYGQSWKGPEQ